MLVNSNESAISRCINDDSLIALKMTQFLLVVEHFFNSAVFLFVDWWIDWFFNLYVV